METQTKDKDKTQTLKLDEQFFAKFFSDVKLGEKPADQCTDEEIMAGAIPKLWSKALEKEFEKFVSEIVSPDVFELVTNPYKFNSIHWSERRKMIQARVKRWKTSCSWAGFI